MPTGQRQMLNFIWILKEAEDFFKTSNGNQENLGLQSGALLDPGGERGDLADRRGPHCGLKVRAHLEGGR